MGKSGKAQTIGYSYYMTLFMGLCRGPVDEVVEIKIGDRVAWSGSITDNTQTPINQPNLFGGHDSEGGIIGTLIPLFGRRDQIAPQFLKDHMPGPVPGFRGMLTMIFDGVISEINPYPKPWKFRMRRSTAGWEDDNPWFPERATVWLGNVRAMNAVHILYECITNSEWGRGLERDLLDDAAWRNAAEVAFQEGMGLCLRWSRQDDLDTFVKSVVDHLGASIGVDRQSGLIRIKLMREDYRVEDLPHYDYDSGLLSVQANDIAPRDQVPNEIIVQWHEPVTDETRQVRVQNLASMQASNGRKLSKVVEYPGFPTGELAARAAERDLQIATEATRRYTLVCDRRAWKLFPGEVILFSERERGIDRLALRIASVEEASDTKGEITVSGVIDVFSLSRTAYVETPENAWRPPVLSPEQPIRTLAREATFQEIAVGLLGSGVSNPDAGSGAIVVYAVRRNSADLAYRIATRTSSEPFVEYVDEEWTGSADLETGITAAATAMNVRNLSNVDTSRINGSGVQIGDEIAVVRSHVVTSAGLALTVGRGCADTIPSAHSPGAPVIFLYPDGASDGREYVRGEIVDVKTLTIALAGMTPVDEAPVRQVPVLARQGRPYPPGNVRVGGQTAIDGFRYGSQVALTWAHRDRLAQADKFVDHGSGSIGPESGTSYIVVVRSRGSTVEIERREGLTGTSINLDSSNWPVAVTVSLWSVRGGLESTQRYDLAGTRG